MLIQAMAVSAAAARASTVHFEDLGGFVVMNARVNGKGPYHFVVDTGAITVLTKNVARRIGLSSNATQNAPGAGEKTVQVQLADLARVEVGTAIAKHVTAAIVDLPMELAYQGRFGTIDGIVGYSFLQNFVATFDYRNHSLTLQNPAGFTHPRAAAMLPFVNPVNEPIPYVNATIDGASGTFEIDTGNSGVAIVNEAFATTHAIETPAKRGVAETVMGFGGEVVSTVIRVRQLHVGTTTLPQMPMRISHAKAGALVAAGLDGNLGYRILHRFTVTIDFADRTLYLQPNANASAYEPYVTPGISWRRNADGTLAVVFVAESLPAARAGIYAGDTILAVNEMPVAQMDSRDLSTALQASRVLLTVRSRGVMRKVRLKLMDALP